MRPPPAIPGGVTRWSPGSATPRTGQARLGRDARETLVAVGHGQAAAGADLGAPGPRRDGHGPLAAVHVAGQPDDELGGPLLRGKRADDGRIVFERLTPQHGQRPCGAACLPDRHADAPLAQVDPQEAGHEGLGWGGATVSVTRPSRVGMLET